MSLGHALVGVLALGLLVVAALLAAVYLVQRHQLRARRFGWLFFRLPALEPLSRLQGRLFGLGLLACSLASATGVLSTRAWPSDPGQWGAVGAPLLLGLVVLGRRAAGTRLLAFSSLGALVVLAGSLVGGQRLAHEARRAGVPLVLCSALTDPGISSLTTTQRSPR